MKTYRANLNIQNINFKIEEINFTENPSDFKASLGYMERKIIRNMVIESNLFTRSQVEIVEKVGCEKVILNQMLVSPMTKFRYLLAEREAKKILRGLELFMAAFGSDLGVVYLPKKNSNVISSMLPHIRKMPNIYEDMIVDRYPLGIERVFSRRILHNRGDYFPGKASSLILSPEKALSFYEHSRKKQGFKPVHKIAVLKGKKLYYVSVDKKMTVALLLKKIGLSAEGLVVAGDPLNGRVIDDIFKENLAGKSVICIISEQNVGPFKCYNCGRCFEVCPERLSVTRSRKILKNKSGINLSSQIKNCDGCGLCAYFCPGWLK